MNTGNKPFSAAFMVIERDDAVLIPGPPPTPDFQSVEVILDPGITVEMIDTDDVALLESKDCDKLRFTKFNAETWCTDFEQYAFEGWMPIGPGLCRYYPTYQEYLATTEE